MDMDKFSFLIDYIDKNKNLQLHGFKRSYFGNIINII